MDGGFSFDFAFGIRTPEDYSMILRYKEVHCFMSRIKVFYDVLVTGSAGRSTSSTEEGAVLVVLYEWSMHMQWRSSSPNTLADHLGLLIRTLLNY